jgi:hypothetical protein
MNNSKLTVRLPSAELDFAKHYAKENGVSLTALIHRYFSRLRLAKSAHAPEEVASITGILPSQLNVRDAYAAHTQKKHQ